MLSAIIHPEDSSAQPGLFVSTFAENPPYFIRSVNPQGHFNFESAILPFAVIRYDSSKYVEGKNGQKLIA